MTMTRHFSVPVLLVFGWLGGANYAHAQATITITVDTTTHGAEIPSDFAGLGFETKSEVANEYGVHGNFFSPANTQLITLFQNMGLKNIRVGGGTVDGSGEREHCVTPIPTRADIDNLFEFARAAGVSVIYSFRLLNLAACADSNLPEEDARAAQYIWQKYRANLNSFSIGNEPDVRHYHTEPGREEDPAIVDTTPGVPGSGYPSYLADWRRFAQAILKLVPEAKFSGPDTAATNTGTYTPSPSDGVSWTQKFAEDEKNTGNLKLALQHYYVWGHPGSTTAQEAIDNMLSRPWVDGTEVGMQPAGPGHTEKYTPYFWLFSHNLEPLGSDHVAYRLTEANDCLHGVVGASDGYASALWALDFMHWWAAHGMEGVNFHNNPWLPTDTVVPFPNPCAPSGCENYHITPKGYGIRAFALGSDGYVEPAAISNPRGINLTAYAVGDSHHVSVTVINKTHSSTHDSTDAMVTIQAKGFKAAGAAYMMLTDGEPGNASLMTATLGGAEITDHSRWEGKWIPLTPGKDGSLTLTVPATAAAVVNIRAAAKTIP